VVDYNTSARGRPGWLLIEPAAAVPGQLRQPCIFSFPRLVNHPMTESQPQSVSPSVVVVPQRPRLLRRLFMMLFGFFSLILGFGCVILLVFAGLTLLTGGSDSVIEETYHSLDEHGKDKIAIITVEGTIIEGDGFVKKQIDHVRDDKHVKAIVLRVDSPGGTVTGSDYIYHHLLKLKADKQKENEGKPLPLVVSMGGLAASGGYYVSMAVGDTPESIFAEPTTWTGSIGVIIPHYDLSGLLKRADVSDDSIKSGPLKQMGSFTRAMTPEEKKALQQLVDDSFSRFKKIVRDGRPRFKAHPEELDKIATGQVFDTDQALANGLVDKEGFIEEAIDRVATLAGLDKKKTKVVKYKRPFALFEGLLASHSAQSRGSELQTVLDLAAPRAYFLCTWLPILARN
jgi:protease-4